MRRFLFAQFIHCAFALFLAASLSSAHAATTLYLDAAGGTTTWDYSTSNWSTGGGSATTWLNDSDASFKGTGGTVNASDNIASVNSLTFGTAYSLNGGTITLTGVGGNITTSSIATIQSVLAGAVGLTKLGAGTLTLTNVNTFSGDTTVSAGSLVLGNSNALLNSCLNCTGGMVNFGSLTTVKLGGLAGNQSLALTNDHSQAIALTVGGSTGYTTYSGVLSGIGSLTKVGTQALYLNGANMYTGVTKVSEGTLLVTNSNALQNSTFDNSGAGNLTFSGLTTATLGGLKGNNNLSLLDNLSSMNGISLYVGNNNESTTFGGVFCGAPSFGGGPFRNSTGRLIKIGTGTLTLTNMNTAYVSVPAVVSNGALQLGDGTTNGSIAGNITNNASLIFNNGTDQTFSCDISGTGAVTKTGAGVLTLNGTNNYSGGTFINGGILAVDSESRLGTTPSTAATNIRFNGNGTLRWNNAFNLSANRQISIGSNATATFDIPAVCSSTDVYGQTTYTTGSAIVAGAISGMGNLTKVGTGIIALTGVNTYSGHTTVVAGVLKVAKTSSLADYNTAGNIEVRNGGTLAVNVGGAGEWTEADINTLRSNAVFNAGSLIGIDTTNATSGFTYSGSIKGDVGLMKFGSNALSLANTQTYSGATIVNAGALILANSDNCLPTATALTLNGSLYVRQRQVVASLSGSGSDRSYPLYSSGLVLNDGSTFIVGDSNNTFYSGPISGSGQFIKQGSGTLSLGGFSTSFSGNTTINAGTLELDGFLSGTIANNSQIIFNVGQSATASIGTSSTVYMSGSGSLSKTGAGKLTLGMPNTYFGDTTVRGGQFVLNHVDFMQNSTLDYNNYGGTLSFGTLTSSNLGGLKGNQDLALTNTDLAAVAISVGNNNQSTEFGGILRGNGALIKVGAGTLTLSGANNYTGATNVNAGTLVVKGSAIAAALGNNHTTTTNVATGSSLVFDYSTTGASVASLVKSALTAAYANKFASGEIYSSTANATGYALGWVDDATAKNVTVKVAQYGDADLDGKVSLNDLRLLLNNYGVTSDSAVWGRGDFDYDDMVSLTDLGLLLNNYDSTSSGTTVATTGVLDAAAVSLLATHGITAVPEPSMPALLIGLLISLATYGWRKRR